VAAAQEAIARFGSRVLVLDDAFQHRRIARDLDIVMLDASAPFGYGHLLPRGLLREPVEEMRRADVAVLSRASLADPLGREEVRRTIARYAPDALWAEADHVPVALCDSQGTQRAPDELRGKDVAAFCAIGNPAAFRATVEQIGCRVVAMREFADHYSYRPDDLRRLAAWADGLDVAAVLCTHKDLVKLQRQQLGRHLLWALGVRLTFWCGQQALEERLAGLLENGAPARETPSSSGRGPG
jgi:tetraacyldisaccharide 4'-kinase